MLPAQENGGKVVDTMKEADYVIIPRGDANMFREVITSARNYGPSSLSS